MFFSVSSVRGLDFVVCSVVRALVSVKVIFLSMVWARVVWLACVARFRNCVRSAVLPRGACLFDRQGRNSVLFGVVR